MQHKVIGILSLSFALFLFAVPASAVELPACAPPDGSTHFTFVAQDQAIWEGGDTSKTIDGNVLVTSSTGLAKIGKNTHINGTVIAKTIAFHSSGTSTIAHCVADVITGPNGCGDQPTTFTAYAGTHLTCVNPPLGTLIASPATGPGSFTSLCGPTPVVNACANSAAPLTVAEGATVNLPADNPATCFGALVLEKGGVLNLTGTYAFKTVRMKSGSQLNGPATVNVNGQFITEPGVFISNITLNTPFATGDVVAIFNNSILTNVVINAPFGRCHPHTGTSLLECSEMCCKSLDIEPTSAVCNPPDFLCVCEPGFKFLLPPAAGRPAPGSDPVLARDCVPCEPGDTVSNCVVAK